jgi:hypothetical protein
MTAVSKIKTGGKLLKVIKFVADKVRAVTAVKTRMFRKMAQYARNRDEVAIVRQYLDTIIKPCPVN